MFILEKKKVSGYRQGDKTFYSNWHIGTDWQANYDPIKAPFDGEITKIIRNAPNGGNTLWFKPDKDKTLHRFLHLSEFKKGLGRVKEGDVIAISGNTGLSTKPHLHHDISKNGVLELNNRSNFIDPEVYDWTVLKTTFMKVTIVANNITWDYKSLLPTISQWFKQYSNNKLEVVFDWVDVNLGKPPLQSFQNSQCTEINWYREKVTPLATGELTVLLLNPADYPSTTWGFMTYGDEGKPARAELSCYDDPNFPEAHLVVHRVFHEICHALYFFTGQTDRTHDLLTNPAVPESQLPANRRILLNEIDYVKLQNKLITIKPMPQNQAKVVKSKTSPKVYVVYEMPSMEYLTTKANIEGFVIPNPIPNSDSL